MSATGKAPVSEEELINLLNRGKEYAARLNAWKYMENVYSHFVFAFGVYIGKMFKEFPKCLKSDAAKEKIAYFINNILEGGYMLLPIVLPISPVSATEGGESILLAATVRGKIDGKPKILVELYLGYFGLYPPYEMVGVFTHELLHHAAKVGVLSHSEMIDILTESDCLYLQALVTPEQEQHWENEEETRRLHEAFMDAYKRFGNKIEMIQSEVKELFHQVTGLTDKEVFEEGSDVVLLQYSKECQVELPSRVSPGMLSKEIYWANHNWVGNLSIDMADYLGLTEEDLARLRQFASEWAKV